MSLRNIFNLFCNLGSPFLILCHTSQAQDLFLAFVLRDHSYSYLRDIGDARNHTYISMQSKYLKPVLSLALLLCFKQLPYG